MSVVGAVGILAETVFTIQCAAVSAEKFSDGQSGYGFAYLSLSVLAFLAALFLYSKDSE